MAPRRRDFLAATGAIGLTGIAQAWSSWATAERGAQSMPTPQDASLSTADDPGARLAAAARARVGQTRIYDPAYRAIGYPGGDAPADRGVCTDVIIRAYRTAFGVDLQQHVHEDISAAFLAYPAARIWGQTAPDTNIDHRRVPNLETFLARQNARLEWGSVAQSLDPTRLKLRVGDLVTWRLDGGLPHIGIVGATQIVPATTATVIHNIGTGTREDSFSLLARHPVIGHFRWWPIA